jgi:CRP-like cAMP-binding protein
LSEQKLLLDNNPSFAAWFTKSWVYILKGTFHFLVEHRIVRFYSGGCWLPTMPQEECASVFSDFGGEVEIFNSGDFRQCLAANPDLLRRFLEYAALQERIAGRLCALQVQAPVKAPVSLKPFPAGEIIIREGEKALEAFEMVEGRASVTVQGREISVIRDGQIFGELSFFTDSNRFATVTATQDCLVQVMDKEVFLSLMQHRPHMVETLVRTLCQRLLEANEKATG